MALAKLLKTHNKKFISRKPKKSKVKVKKSLRLPFTLDKLPKKVKGNGLSPSLSAIVDYYLSTREKFKPYKMYLSRNELVGFHPSEITSKNVCIRFISFRYLLESKLFNKNNSLTEDLFDRKIYSAQLQRIWDTGHVIHGLIQYGYLPDYFGIKNKGILFDTEVPIINLFKKFMIGGTSDIWAILQDGLKRVIDIKTINGVLFNKLHTADDIGLGYMGQASLYSYGLKIPENPMVFFWNKNDSKLKEFTFPINLDLVKHGLLVSYHAKNFLHGKSFPEMIPECKRGGKRFFTCEFASICGACKHKEDLLKMLNVNTFKDVENYHLQAVKKLGANNGENKR